MSERLVITLFQTLCKVPLEPHVFYAPQFQNTFFSWKPHVILSILTIVKESYILERNAESWVYKTYLENSLVFRVNPRLSENLEQEELLEIILSLRPQVCPWLVTLVQ